MTRPMVLREPVDSTNAPSDCRFPSNLDVFFFLFSSVLFPFVSLIPFVASFLPTPVAVFFCFCLDEDVGLSIDYRLLWRPHQIQWRAFGQPQPRQRRIHHFRSLSLNVPPLHRWTTRTRRPHKWAAALVTVKEQTALRRRHDNYLNLPFYYQMQRTRPKKRWNEAQNTPASHLSFFRFTTIVNTKHDI